MTSYIHPIAPSGYTYIYTLSDKDGIRYVGKATNLNERYRKHLQESKLKRTVKEKWIDSRLTKGEEIYMEPLDTVSALDWSATEVYWIQQFKAWGFSLVNGTDGGEGSNGFKGRTHSVETKEVLRAKGKLHTPTKVTGEKHGRSKLTLDDVNNMRAEYATGTTTHRKLAVKYGIAKINIGKILNGKYWK